MVDFLAIRLLKSCLEAGDISKLNELTPGELTTDCQTLVTYTNGFFTRFARLPKLVEVAEDLDIEFETYTDNLDFIFDLYKKREPEKHKKRRKSNLSM
jgi:hypothetical protein